MLLLWLVTVFQLLVIILLHHQHLCLESLKVFHTDLNILN